MQQEPQKLNRLLNGNVCVYISENRTFSGKLLSYDEHTNVVLSECEEVNTFDNERIIRNHPLITIRGSHIISIEAAVLPPFDMKKGGKSIIQKGIGTVKPFSRSYV